MKTLSSKQHLGIAFLILVVSYTAFTLLHPAFLPHPEDFSPWPYLVATVFLLVLCIRNRKQPHAWAYWLVFVLCTLAFLDESGYGTEIFGWPSLYIARYHVYIHDLHSLIGLGIDLAELELQKLRWNGAQFVNFLLLDAGIILAAIVFIAAVRNRLAKAIEKRWQDRILAVSVTSLAIIGLAAVVYLFSLPADPKNAFLFGHSLFRILSALVMLVLSLGPLACWLSRKAGVEKKIVGWLKQGQRLNNLAGLLVVPISLGIIYQFYMPFVFLPDQVARYERLTPIVMWVLAEIFVVWLAALLWAGRLRQPVDTLGKRTLDFLRSEPVVIYGGFAVLLIIIAQMIDMDVIPLNDWIHTPNFHVQLWGLWTEETFEMTAAYEFIAAGLFFPIGLFAKKKLTRRKK